MRMVERVEVCGAGCGMAVWRYGGKARQDDLGEVVRRQVADEFGWV
jgi:hypothetical protein